MVDRRCGLCYECRPTGFGATCTDTNGADIGDNETPASAGDVAVLP